MLLLGIVFLLLLLINMPIAFVIGISGLAWFSQTPGFTYAVAAQRVVAQTQSIAFLAVPFFIFAGSLMNHTGITRHLISFSRLLTRRMVGGIAQVSVLLSTLMGGVSGSAVADASMEARILGPEMIKRGYSKGYAAGVICLTSLITATIPPSLGLLTINALTAADSVLIPIQTEYYALEGVTALVSTVNRLQHSVNKAIQLEGVVLTMYDGRTNLSLQVASQVKKHFRGKVFSAIIPRNVRLGEAPSHGQPIHLYDPRSAGAEAYRALAAELVKRNAG